MPLQHQAVSMREKSGTSNRAVRVFLLPEDQACVAQWYRHAGSTDEINYVYVAPGSFQTGQIGFSVTISAVAHKDSVVSRPGDCGK